MADITESILVVDDEADIRDALLKYLQGKGHTVITAENGKQAASLLDQRSSQANGNAMIKIIISDWMMTEGDGVEFLTQLRQGPHKDIPFILMSGVVTREQLAGAIQYGPDGVLLKPFSFDILEKKIEDAIIGRMAKATSR